MQIWNFPELRILLLRMRNNLKCHVLARCLVQCSEATQANFIKNNYDVIIIVIIIIKGSRYALGPWYNILLYILPHPQVDYSTRKEELTDIIINCRLLTYEHSYKWLPPYAHLEGLEHASRVIPHFHVSTIITERVGSHLTNATHTLLNLALALLAWATTSLGILHTIPSISHIVYVRARIA